MTTAQRCHIVGSPKRLQRGEPGVSFHCIAATAKPGGGYTSAWTRGWVVNNIVRFTVG